jgi:hypothetical protein
MKKADEIAPGFTEAVGKVFEQAAAGKSYDAERAKVLALLDGVKGLGVRGTLKVLAVVDAGARKSFNAYHARGAAQRRAVRLVLEEAKPIIATLVAQRVDAIIKPFTAVHTAPVNLNGANGLSLTDQLVLRSRRPGNA